jgi:hypothetical protein
VGGLGVRNQEIGDDCFECLEKATAFEKDALFESAVVALILGADVSGIPSYGSMSNEKSYGPQLIVLGLASLILEHLMGRRDGGPADEWIVRTRRSLMEGLTALRRAG